MSLVYVFGLFVYLAVRNVTVLFSHHNASTLTNRKQNREYGTFKIRLNFISKLLFNKTMYKNSWVVGETVQDICQSFYRFFFLVPFLKIYFCNFLSRNRIASLLPVLSLLLTRSVVCFQNGAPAVLISPCQ